MKRLNWDEYFMLQALMIRSRGTCSSRASVGCVLVKDKRIIATGYNGSVKGDVHCDEEGHLMIDNHCVRTVHAEQNAIVQCAKFGMSCEGSTAYVTHYPCLNCTKLLIQSGVKKVIYYKSYRIDEITQKLFKQADVDILSYGNEFKLEQFESILNLK